MKSRATLLLYIIILFSFFLSTAFAKKSDNKYNGTIFQHALIQMDKNQNAPLEIRFNENQKITVSQLFNEYQKSFNWSSDNETKQYRQFRDDLGQIHHRFKQYYKGIEVAEVQYLVHEEEGVVTYAHGKLIHGLDLDVVPRLSDLQALQYALNHIGADFYMWENPKNEAFLKKIENNRNATYFPVGELKISTGLKPKTLENFKLVYRFDIYAEYPMSRNYVDVDANTGEIIGVIPRLYSDDVPGTGTTLYNGAVDIVVSDNNFEDTAFDPNFHVNDWNAYGGTGTSWWMADTSIGSSGGYSDVWYDVLDTDPINLYGEEVTLTFRHRYAGEPPSPIDQMPEGFDGWDGMNVRISNDGGETWQVLQNPDPIYSNESLFSFGNIFGEGENVPGWTGVMESWTDVNFNISAYIGYDVIIRFAFSSDQGVSTEFGGDPDWFGWQIDDIVVKNLGDTLFYNSGGEAGMNPRNNIFTTLPGNYRLREIGRGRGIETYDLQNQDYIWLAVDFVDDDPDFSEVDVQAGVSVHWAVEASYDYFLSEHARNSFDDDGGKILSYVHLGVDVFNAFWNGAYMQFGDGDATNGYRPLVGIDIVGHELTHGVTQYSADLIYQDEYGALNESFSDIFGEHIESYATEGGHDWLIGDDSGALRSFINPNEYGQPDTYDGSFWYSGSEDNGGVHINSGVQNFWFYLLVVGGSGVNDNGDSYSVESIGWADAAKIAYRNLTVYLMPTSEHEDARRGSLNAARDLFGVVSRQFNAVLDAWNAVGVYYPFVGPYAENTRINKSYFVPGNDTLIVTSEINNPKNHEITVETLIESIDLSVMDSILLHDDGLDGDSAAADGIWSAFWAIPEGEYNYQLTTSVVSLDSGYQNIANNAAMFTTKGPVVLEKYEITSEDSIVNPGDLITLIFTLQNFGQTDTVHQISSHAVSLNECTEIIALSDPNYGDMAPGESVEGSRPIRIRFNDCPAPTELAFALDMYSEENFFWSDTFVIDIVTGLKDIETTLPTVFSLDQNYPNPFNPTTKINYELPITDYVDLSIYNALGQKVATLVSKDQAAGSYEVQWDAAGFASGVYYYKINAGEIQAVQKMILLR